MTFIKINNFSTCSSLPDNCKYSKNAGVRAAVVALTGFRISERAYVHKPEE